MAELQQELSNRAARASDTVQSRWFTVGALRLMPRRVEGGFRVGFVFFVKVRKVGPRDNYLLPNSKGQSSSQIATAAAGPFNH